MKDVGSTRASDHGFGPNPWPAPGVRPVLGWDYNRVMRCLLLVVGVIGLGCGSQSGRPEAAVPDAAGLESPGDRCVEDANLPRLPPPDAPERIDLAQVLVRHTLVRGAAGVTRNRVEACHRALEAREKLLSGASWDAVHQQYSDSQGATGGALYDVKRDDLEPVFANAAFSLDVDELSHVVETPRGFQVIWRKK